MRSKEYIVPSKRRFIGLMSGLLSGFFFCRPGRTRAATSDIKHVLGNIELESMIRSTPRKNPAITWKQNGETTLLVREGSHPLLEINRTGKMIWDACNGKNTPEDISEIVQRTFQVDTHKAYVDCLFFLRRLITRGAVQL